MAVFPLAYAIILPALYMPITLMVVSLIFRGVAFEFRWRTRAESHQPGVLYLLANGGRLDPMQRLGDVSAAPEAVAWSTMTMTPPDFMA